MPDITLPFSATANTLTAASGPMQNLYNPGVAPDSFEVIDGWLDNANRQVGWDIRGPHIRNRSMASGRMVGRTGNLDWTGLVFPSTNADNDAYIPVSGCAMEFYLPVSPTVLTVTWQIITAWSDHVDNSSNTDPVGSPTQATCEMRFYFDQARQSGHFRQQPAFDRPTANNERGQASVYRDRIWSGSWSSMNGATTAGWHRAYVALWLNIPGNATWNFGGILRTRVARMTHRWRR